MRILLVNTRHFFGGGDSTYTFALADLLRSHGHEVAFFAMADERNLPDPNLDLFVSPIDFRELNRRKNPARGLQVLARCIYSTEARSRFSRLLDRFQPDLVHLQTIHAHLTPSVIFEAKKRRLPVVWTLHDYKLVCPNSHFFVDRTGQVCERCRGGAFYQAVFRRCKKGSLLASGMAALEAYAHRWMGVRERVDAWLAPSAFLQGKLLESGFPPQKVHPLPLFLPAKLFTPLRRDQGYLLFLGRIEEIKGIAVLLAACRRIPQVKVILAGRVLQEDRIADLPENVSYVGLKTGAELEALRQNCLALVLPSLCYENQPFSALEAFACAKPVIGSRLGGISELVGEDELGMLVPPGDPEQLAAAMGEAVRNPGKLAEMGQRAYRYVLANHSAETHYARLLEIYQVVLHPG